MNVLFLTIAPPYPPNDGGRIRTFNLMRQAAKQHSVNLVAFLPQDRPDDSWMPIREICAEVHLLSAPAVKRTTPAQKLTMMFRRQPSALHLYQSSEMETLLRELVQRRATDLVHVVEPYMIPYVKKLDGPARVMDHTDIEALKQRRLLFTDPKRYRPYWWLRWLEHFRWQAFEIESLAWFDAHCAVSERDAAYFRRHAPDAPVFSVPNGVDVDHLRPRLDPANEPTLLYLGSMDYPPNADAALWFAVRVLPIIREAVPGVRLLIVGRNPAPQVLALGVQPGIRVTGTVPDVRPYYEQAHALVVPLRSGGGTRLKILEALATGVPVVSTSLGAEGLDLRHGVDFLVADTPDALAEQTIRVLSDATLRASLAEHGRSMVTTHYRWDMIGRNLLNVYESAAGRRRKSERPGNTVRAGS